MEEKKIFKSFLLSLVAEEKDLNSLNFEELSEILKKTSPGSDYRKRVDKKLFPIISKILEKDFYCIEEFFIELVIVLDSISPDSKNEFLVLRRLREVLKDIKEEGVLIKYYSNLLNFPKGARILLLKIRDIWSKKDPYDLIEIKSGIRERTLNKLLEELILEKLPSRLKMESSSNELLRILSLLPFSSRIKSMVEERLEFIFENKENRFFFSIFSFDQLYLYWKNFSNRSKGRSILLQAIKENIYNDNLEKLYKKLIQVEIYDSDVRNLILNKLMVKIRHMTFEDKNDYKFFVNIVYNDITEKDIPQDLLPIVIEKVKTILKEGA